MVDTVPLPIAIVGPTGVGKTALSIELALRCNGEILSCDSMQIYKGMDIGTGKEPPSTRMVPHFGIDICQPGEEYSAALFQSYGRLCISDITQRGHVPILCGGTGLYLRAVIDGYEFPAGSLAENPIRQKYTEYLQEHTVDELWGVLNACDPESASKIHPNNTRRVIRALELHETGGSYARQLENLQSIPQVIPCRIYGLRLEREALYERINSRVDRMFEQGLVQEVQGLLDKGFQDALTAPQAIGYKEIVSYLSADCTLEQAKDAIKQASRRYAKRQISWFKSDSRVIWLSAEKPLDDLATTIIEEASLPAR